MRDILFSILVVVMEIDDPVNYEDVSMTPINTKRRRTLAGKAKEYDEQRHRQKRKRKSIN